MLFPFDSINDAFRGMTFDILNRGIESSPRDMKTKEIFAPRIEIKDPKKRWLTSRVRNADIVYGIGEFFWYMSATNELDYIQYYAPSIGKYSDDGKTLNSGYGFRIFNKWYDQWQNVIEILTNDPDSRQAIIFIRCPEDGKLDTKDSVCTNTLQFFIRDNKLIMITNMRSNDLMVGFVYDVFCFTMMQELMALQLGVELGSYIHIPNSLHIYEPWFDRANEIVNEDIEDFDLGFMSYSVSSPMKQISTVCSYEYDIRNNNFNLQNFCSEVIFDFAVSDYWKQIIMLLLFKRFFKKESSVNDSIIKVSIRQYLLQHGNYFFSNYVDRKMESLDG